MPLPASYLQHGIVGSRKSHTRPVVTHAIVYESFVDTAAKVTNGISTSHAGQVSVGTVNMTIGGSLASGGVATLARPRNVVITVTHSSSVVALSGTITGTDSSGNVMTEAWSVTAGSTSKTFTGAKAFKTVTQITETNAADASTDTIIAGSGDKIGLRAPVAVASLVKETSGGSVVTNGTLVAASTSASADPFGTYAPNTVPDGSVDYEVWYISSDPAASRS